MAMTVSDIAPTQNIALRLHHKYLITEGKRNVKILTIIIFYRKNYVKFKINVLCIIAIVWTIIMISFLSE